LLGIKERPTGLQGFLGSFIGNVDHLSMWDNKSLSQELNNVGFTDIRTCQFNDSEAEMVKYVEDIGRFKNAVETECRK